VQLPCSSPCSPSHLHYDLHRTPGRLRLHPSQPTLPTSPAAPPVPVYLAAHFLVPSSTSDGRATLPTKGFSLQLRVASPLSLFYSPLVLRSSALSSDRRIRHCLPRWPLLPFPSISLHAFSRQARQVTVALLSPPRGSPCNFVEPLHYCCFTRRSY
jgi:hypothetical protein